MGGRHTGRRTKTKPERHFGGLMTDKNGDLIAQEYEAMNEVLKQWGCTLEAPFMTLSFMALLVIPDLKLSDKGLFDGKEFRFTSLELG
jgi:adenine deaminase